MEVLLAILSIGLLSPPVLAQVPLEEAFIPLLDRVVVAGLHLDNRVVFFIFCFGRRVLACCLVHGDARQALGDLKLELSVQIG